VLILIQVCVWDGFTSPHEQELPLGQWVHFAKYKEGFVVSMLFQSLYSLEGFVVSTISFAKIGEALLHLYALCNCCGFFY
jgi:hypothetical protein